MRTVLTVDDSASIRQVVANLLTNAGYRVVEAANGAEGLKQLQAGGVNLVVTDLNMPVMDGLTFIREARKLPTGKGIPILFLSTESDAVKKQQAKEAGATGWIVKPFQNDQFLAVVGKVLR
ncbi:response regulator [Paracraurococcus ruber]|uniref:Two-component system response regulator n=1 Tax=Paracraurococcus ruber TaxID=77675 RepID=A0ABS1CQP3_9PROT|nr:response regulator [Paracraurococcus ruber]MBK1656668.1 two-component system response regulator [Paracraurococcus ruber]TDG33712.1 response regulator [Paracraurococcus ruber]